MSQVSKSEPPPSELWFQTKADIVRGSDTVARALVCVDPTRGRDFSILVAVLKDSGRVDVLAVFVPLPTLVAIATKFQELYDEFKKESDVQDQPSGG